MANEYSDLISIRSRLKLAASDTAEDAVLLSCLTAASRAIDLIGGRAYFATTATRYYGYHTAQISGRVLTLDQDLLSIANLTNGDGTALAAGSYSLEPRNTPPYRTIRLKSDYTWAWTDSDSEITVEGSWGYAQVPPANVVEATILLALRLFRRKDSPLGVLGMTDLGAVVEIARRDPDVMMLLGPKRAWVA